MQILTEYQNTSGVFPYFYLPAYAAYIKKSQNADLVFISDARENSMCCKIWRNRFLKFMQPVYPPLNRQAERLEEAGEKEFLDKLLRFVKDKKLCDRMVQPENFSIFQTVPTHSTASPFGTYFINLHQKTEEQLLKGMHMKHRNVIRNAEKNGVILKYGPQEIAPFYLLYEQTMKRSNMYCQPLAYFKDFYNYLPQNVSCGVAYFNEKPQGALFMPFTEFGAFYLYGASSATIEVNGAMNYLHWNTMKLLKQQRVKRYDFVGARLSDVSGTRLEGIQKFKKRFGAELQEGYLWKKDIHKARCTSYDGLLKIKCMLRGTSFPVDIIDQERRKST